MDLLSGCTAMKILVVTAHFPPEFAGGYGLQMGWFCDGLALRGHDIEVLTTGFAADSPPGIRVDRRLKFISSSRPESLLRDSLANRFAVAQAIRRFGPDVVLCGAMDGIGFNTYLACQGGPCLAWLGDTWLAQACRDLPAYDAWADLARGGRGSGVSRRLKRGLGWLGRAAGLSATHPASSRYTAVAMSTFVRDDLRDACGPTPPDAPIVPPVLHAAYFGPSGRPVGHSGHRVRHLRVLFASRNEMLKGLDLAILGVAAAVAAGAEVELTIAGLHQERIRPQLERIALAAGIPSRVHWAGSPTLERLVETYRSHDVFLFPSRIVEGLGVVNCEALSCGLPIIGTADSGPADVIHDGQTGYRVPQEDSLAIGHHLTILQNDRELLGVLSGRAVEFAARYHPDRVLPLLESALISVIEKAR